MSHLADFTILEPVFGLLELGFDGVKVVTHTGPADLVLVPYPLDLLLVDLSVESIVASKETQDPVDDTHDITPR